MARRRGTLKLHDWRLRKLMTLRDLDKKSGVSVTTIHAIERSGRTPSLKSIRAISEALGIDPLEIDEFRAIIRGEAGE
jgi:transcriptional regulator with XRE-family HTH domain